MITLNTSDLKEFFRRSKFIRATNISPITSFIKLECFAGEATLLKTNLNNYCIHHLSGEFEPGVVLIDERILTALLGITSSETLAITQAGRKITISDGLTERHFQTEDEKMFPTFPKQDGEKKITKLSKEVLQSIDVAKSYVEAGNLETSLSFVHVKNGNEIFASNHFAIYYKKFKDELPDLMLYTEACNAICSYDEVHHYTVGKYDFFDIGCTTYGFIKTEAKPMAYEPYLSILKKGDGFILDKEYMEKFCELTISSTNSLLPIATIKDNGNRLLFLCEDDRNSSGDKMEIDVVKKISFDDYSFNPRTVLPILKALPYDFLHITPHERFGYILSSEDDENYAGIISKYIKPNN